MTSSQRQSWDLGRFVRTLVYFQVCPRFSWLQKMFGHSPPSVPQPQANILFDFRTWSGNLQEIWGALDDVVMGGVSASSLQPHPEGALFTGTVSTANSGGFVSVRTRNFNPPLDLANRTGIELTVKGDGQRYKFFLRDQEGWDTVGYASSIDTVADQWITVRLPFAEMIPVFRARTMRPGPALNTAHISSLQLMLSKFEYDGALNPHFAPGNFRLLIATIAVY